MGRSEFAPERALCGIPSHAMSNGLRVHGGAARGRRLATPRGIRPSQGVVKEAVFNILGGIQETRVLDLFAGSGALGIEALSRGAGHVTFVERDDRAIGVIRANLQSLSYLGRASVSRAEVTRWLRANLGEVADAGLVLADPPYNDAVLDRALQLLDEGVSEGALVVVEHSSRSPLSPLRRLRPVRERRYGDAAVTLLEAVD
jgi:16S rRNA (guanine966-N2)-methyltransferase